MKIIIYSLLLFLLWAPRILCILFAAFISLFGHLIPPILIIIILILSWRWAWIGGIIYILLGIAYIIWSSHNPDHIIYISLFLVGTLFLVAWFFRKDIKKAKAIYWGEETS